MPDNVAELRAGQWNKKEYSKARGLFGRTLGLLGYGNIGQEMARRAHAFGMPRRRLEPPLRCRREDRPATRRCRFASPRRRRRSPRRATSSASTSRSRPRRAGSSTRRCFDALKPGSYFINTARGEVVDYAALEQRRPRARHPRRPRRVRERAGGGDRRVQRRRSCRCPNVYGTHHIGASTDQAQEAIAAETVRIVADLQEHRQGAERREPGDEDAGDAHAGRPAPRPARRARARVRAPARRRHQRAGDRERDLRGRARRPSRASISTARRSSRAAATTIQDGNRDILDLHVVRSICSHRDRS